MYSQTQLQEALDRIKADHRLRDIQQGLLKNNYVRAVNYHSTEHKDRDRFDREIAEYARHFSSVSIQDLERFLETGKWHKDKPGLILSIFEGFRHHHDVMLPILEKHGMTGWFHLPPFFLDVPVKDQMAFAEAHELHITAIDEYPDGRVAMSWDEVRRIAQNHVLCCHSGTHFKIELDTSDEDMRREIVDSKRRFEEMAGVPVEVFCWLYGEEFSYNPRAAEYIKQAGYKYVVGNIKIERVVPR